MKYTTLILSSTTDTYLSDDIEEFLKSLQKKTRNADIKKYIDSKFRKYLINDFEKTQIKRAPSDAPKWVKDNIKNKIPVYTIKLSAKDKKILESYVDELKILVKERDITRLSFKNLQKRVEGDSNNSTKAIIRKPVSTNNSIIKNNNENKNKNKNTNIKPTTNSSILREYPNGFSWIELTSREDIDKEGKLMNISTSYYTKIKTSGVRVFSLRNQKNLPRVTLELKSNKEIFKIKGDIDEFPSEKYIKYVVDFLNKKYIEYKSINLLELNLCGILEINNKYYNANNLPDNFKVQGNLYLNSSIITKLPENLSVEGSLDIATNNLVSLPKGLNVTGNLNLSSSTVSELPAGLKVGEDLILTNSNVTEIPKNVSIGGKLYLGRTKVVKLNSGLSVGKLLHLKDSLVEELPEDSYIAVLDLRESKVRKLPKGLTTYKINMTNAWITEIAENTRVRDSLYLYKSTLTKLPKNLTVDKTLDASFSSVNEVGSNLKVGETLYLNNTSVTKLPSRVHVGGNLDLSSSSIKVLPKDLSVDGNLILTDTKINALPLGMKIKGKIIPNDILKGKIKFYKYNEG